MKKIMRVMTITFVLLTCILTITGCSKKEKTNTSKMENDGKGKIYLLLNTEGLGQVSYYIDEERKSDFDDEYPKQQAYIRLNEKTKVTIRAKADEGYKFVKWTKDNKEYSKKEELEITVDSATELTAVFTS